MMPAEPTQHDLSAADRIGPYRIRAVIGSEPEGVRCTAEDTARDGRPVTLCVLPLVIARRAEAVERLRRIARQAHGLAHPGLLRLLELWRDPRRTELLCVVWERCADGETLEALIERSGAVEAEQVGGWAKQIAAAIDHLHAHGMAHGSIGAGSIVIDGGGRARIGGAVIDAELRQLHRRGAAAAVKRSPRRRLGGRAPDSAADERRGDLRCLAAALYTALSGRAPSAGAPAPIAGLSAQMNMGLLDALDAGKPGPHSAAELVSAMWDGPRPSGRAAPRATSLPLRPLAAAAALMMVLGAGLWMMRPGGGVVAGAGAGTEAGADMDAGTDTDTDAGADAVADTVPHAVPDAAPAPVAAPVALAVPEPDPVPVSVPTRPPSQISNLKSRIPSLVYLEPGRFVMGDRSGDPMRRAHARTIERGFWIGAAEVTRGEFHVFVAATGYVTDAERAGWALGIGDDGRWRRVAGLTWRAPGFAQDDDHPVVCVSHADALAYCTWLSGRDGRRYDLPSEAQWEYACRAGSAADFWWGSAAHGAGRANVADTTWAERFGARDVAPWSDGHLMTSPVDALPANPWSLHGLHGNVQEWCRDVYAPYPLNDAAAEAGEERARDAAADASEAPRVIRGGSFASSPSSASAAHRDASEPQSAFVMVGFRVVVP